MDDKHQQRRLAMVEHIAALGVRDERILQAMREIPRHLFVPASIRSLAYKDSALTIGEEQTISQPYVVAYMTEALQLKSTDRVLEIGTGSGYQAAVLTQLVSEIFSIEIIDSLGKRAAVLLNKLGYRNISVLIGDGWRGWPEKAPFDAIIVTAAPETIPQNLVEQLAEGGRMILPVGKNTQRLTLLTRQQGKIATREMLPVIFVPMTGAGE